MAILKDNKFKLNTSVGKDFEERLGKKYKYYLSTTRHKLGDFTTRFVSSGTTLFVLDGTKLKHRYKVVPTNYYSFDDLNTSDEAEDRILTNTPEIKAKQYIKEIHSMIDTKYSGKLKRLALYSKIPIYFYENEQDFLLLNKKKSVNVIFKKEDFKEESIRINKMFNEMNLRELLELYHKPIIKDQSIQEQAYRRLSKKASDLYYQLSPYSIKDQMDYLRNQLSSRHPADEEETKLKDKIISILHKKNWSINMFILFIFKKWHPEKVIDIPEKYSILLSKV